MPALDPDALPRHLDRLYRAAWALCGSPHDAEDLVQETFARVLSRPRLLRGQDELAYLMAVLRNTFLTQRRTAARRPRAGLASLEELDPVDPRTRDRPEEATQAHEVFAAIAQLAEHYRLALVAVDIAGLSHREAARLLDTREATIATRVFRARQQLARELSRGDVLPSARPGEQTPPATGSEGTPQGLGSEAALGTGPRLEAQGGLGESSRAVRPPQREDEPTRRRLMQRGPT
jgi:RNA polymerase sigma-70 factor, ECF subfamily